MENLRLISTVICDDVLRNPGGWLSPVSYTHLTLPTN